MLIHRGAIAVFCLAAVFCFAAVFCLAASDLVIVFKFFSVVCVCI